MENNIDYRKLVGDDENTHGKCPKCGTSFDGGDIPENIRENYSKPHKWGRVIGVEVPEMYDGVIYWKCPDCNFMWHRFTGKEVIDVPVHRAAQFCY